MLRSKRYLQSIFITVLLLALSSSAYALNGIPPTLKVAGKDLVLNGAGVKTKFFHSAYSTGLYLAQKNNNAKSIIMANSTMAIRMKIVSKHATLDKVKKGFLRGFKNSSNGNTASVQPQINQFMKMGFNMKIKKGDVFDFIYNPAQGIRLIKNNKQLAIIKGLPFKQTLFGIWLSNKPTQASLKAALLGK